MIPIVLSAAMSVDTEAPAATDGRATGVTPNIPTLSPAPSTDLSNANQFAYSRAVSQFGLNGRFGFARLSFKF
jgi:hypothetical protein